MLSLLPPLAQAAPLPTAAGRAAAALALLLGGATLRSSGALEGSDVVVREKEMPGGRRRRDGGARELDADRPAPFSQAAARLATYATLPAFALRAVATAPAPVTPSLVAAVVGASAVFSIAAATVAWAAARGRRPAERALLTGKKVRGEEGEIERRNQRRASPTPSPFIFSRVCRLRRLPPRRRPGPRAGGRRGRRAGGGVGGGGLCDR